MLMAGSRNTEINEVKKTLDSLLVWELAQKNSIFRIIIICLCIAILRVIVNNHYIFLNLI